MNKKKTNIVGVIITVIVLIILVFLSNLKIENLSYIEKVLSSIVMPIENGITHLKNRISGNSEFFANINSLKSENEKLKKENSELEQALRELEIIESENSTLREYLKLTEQYKGYETVPAYIISKDISNYSSIFVINVGAKSGIEKNMTVIASEGLVGHVISVTDNTAKVQTLTDASNVVSGTLENSKDTVVCRGTLNGNILKANYISTDTELTKDEKLYTSGMGGIYPKGIYIGKIKEIKQTKNITDRTFLLETAVNFEELETILVIKK